MLATSSTDDQDAHGAQYSRAWVAGVWGRGKARSGKPDLDHRKGFATNTSLWWKDPQLHAHPRFKALIAGAR